ncbi:MAG TPA: GTP pyrophosphokinase [Proteiniclasticum sp.]|uniref:GTP pyrophosphokinase n=1 Tax=Proteiniclasticum sp. TaxID=2053595 RepID=UPI000E7DCB60|nr:GTP pyrophosphokinase family protein [Proteiniclasticum sp.]HBW14076.1 GTP pyrophosphokinase [Proteiniclasticum sp.]
MRIANNELSEMEKYIKRIDEDTLIWVQKKSKEVARLMSYYRCAMMEIETKLNVLNEEFSWEMDHNPISSIKKRLKSMPSIIGKLERKGHPLSMENIEEHLMDVAGVRVICSFPEDVYAMRDALIRQDDLVLLEEKDYIKNPKPNGYRSLHLIVGIPIFLAKEKKMMKVEVQLRTIAMDFWASLEHQLRYKKNSYFTKEMAEELTECARISADLDLRMDAIRKSVEKQKHLEP